jgi:hypothetical protein
MVEKGAKLNFCATAWAALVASELLKSSQLDMAPDRTRDLTIGSLEGQRTVFLGGHGLIIGSNNLSTTFSGQINDGEGGKALPGSPRKLAPAL